MGGEGQTGGGIELGRETGMGARRVMGGGQEGGLAWATTRCGKSKMSHGSTKMSGPIEGGE